MLVFVVPVRHPDSVSDWPAVRHMIEMTVKSISAQTSSEWECRIVANRGTDLPHLPRNCRAIFVDLPLPELPDRQQGREAYYDKVREDKGLRILAGLDDVAPESHVMVVDYDDFISRDIAAHVATHPGESGWYVDGGYAYSGGKWVMKLARLHTRCGTCLIVRRDLLGPFHDKDGTPVIQAVKRRLGSHIFLKDDLAAGGTPLSPLPFAGTVYRVGHAHATSGTSNVLRQMIPLRELRQAPLRVLRRVVSDFRPITELLQREFSLPAACSTEAGLAPAPAETTRMQDIPDRHGNV